MDALIERKGSTAARPKPQLLFILGISRTGSKFYMQLLNTHREVSILPELLFQHPMRRCLERDLRRHLSGSPDPESVLEFVRSQRYKDTYVESVGKLEGDEFVAQLKQATGTTTLNVLRAIVRAAGRGCRIAGAKFPVHYSQGGRILSELPASRIIYLTRDPRDIYCSDLVMKTRRFRASAFLSVARALLAPFLLVYTVLKWKHSLWLYRRWEAMFGKDRIELFRYESIAADCLGAARSIAGFVGVDPADLDLDAVRTMDSSFSDGAFGPRWKSSLNFVERAAFNLLGAARLRNYDC